MKPVTAIAALCLCAVFGCGANVNVRSEMRSRVEAYSVKSSFINVNGVNVHFVEAGKGEPLLLVHGWGCWSGYWKKIIPALAEKYHVYALDLLGHGLTDKAGEDDARYATPAQAELVRGFMDAVSQDRWFVVGHSMGGEIAARVALAAPGRVKKLALAAAAGMKSNPEELHWSLRFMRAIRSEKFIAGMSTLTTVRWIFGWYMYHGDNPVDEDIIKDVYYVNFATDESRRAFRGYSAKGLFNDFLNEQAPAISVPTLLLYARGDIVVPAKCGEEYHALIPNSTLVLIENAGHMLFDEHPARFSGELISFFGN